MITMALVYVVKNGFSKLTFLFLAFALSSSAWGLSAGTTSHIVHINEIITKIAYSSSPLVAYSCYVLLTYISFGNLKDRGVKILGSLTFISVVLNLSNLVAAGSYVDSVSGNLIVLKGPLYTELTSIIALIGVAAVAKGVKVYRQKTGEERIKVRWTSLSIISLIIGVYFVAVIVPVIVGNSNYASMIIVPLFLAVVSVDFALTKHKYFDLGMATTVAMSYLIASASNFYAYIYVYFANV